MSYVATSGRGYLSGCIMYVCDMYEETLLVLNDVELLRKIQIPTSEEQFHVNSRKFKYLRGSPMYGIFAALDTLAIQIKKPRTNYVSNSKTYYIVKWFLDILVQAAVSAEYKVIFLMSRTLGAHMNLHNYKA